MQWPGLPRLLGLLHLIVFTTAAPQLRARSSLKGPPVHVRSSLLDVTRHTASGGANDTDSGSSNDWDYNDEGASWKIGSCAATDFSQSPVNLSSTIAAQPIDNDLFFFRYPTFEAPLKMVNDGRFLYARFDNDKGDIGGFSLGQSYPEHLTETYYLYKLVVHTPSEHTFDGVKVPLELQLFHRKKKSKLKDGEADPADTAIVAIGFSESTSEASPFLKSLIDGGLPDQRGGTSLVNRAFPSMLKFSELFKPVFGAQGEKAGFWDYTGSLTQPPCSGGVRWFVRQETLNAKRKTLNAFKDAVERSSDGAPGNARELQVIGERPVFPRFVRNAVQMVVFQPEPPAAFQEALARVEERQDKFEKALNKASAGSAEAIADGASSKEAVMLSRDYKQCMDDLGVMSSELEMAQKKETSDCNLAEGHAKTVDDIAGGPPRIEAAQKAASAKKSCEDQGKVVKAKQGQVDLQAEHCQGVKAKVEAQVNAKATLQCIDGKTCKLTDGVDKKASPDAPPTYRVHKEGKITNEECKNACSQAKDCTGMQWQEGVCNFWLNKRCDVGKGDENPGWSAEAGFTTCTK